MAILHITLLAGFEAKTIDDKKIALKGRKAQALLTCLAMSPGEVWSRDKLMGLLWSDRGDEQARGSLRQTLSELRKAFSKLGENPLLAERDSISLDAKRVESDVARFINYAADGSPASLEQATQLYKGDLLDGFGVTDVAFEEWLNIERGSLNERAQTVMSALSDHQKTSGDFEKATITCRKRLAIDPLQEIVHRDLMSLYVAQGDRSMALKQYQACRDVLKVELDIEPSSKTESLHAEIMKDNDTPQSEKLHLVKTLDLPEKPSIAVLPFTNMSGDAEQEYFADGITEDIITELSRFNSLFVIGRNSSFLYKGQYPKSQDVGRELGVAYIVDGSVRKSGNRVRITAQLVEASTGNHLWGERYDRNLENIFDVQDEVSAKVANMVPGHVEIANRVESERKPVKNLNAYDLVLRSEWLGYQDLGDPDCLRYLEQAIEIDPGYARAHARLANVYAYSVYAETVPFDVAMVKARFHAETAFGIDPNDPAINAVLSETYLILGEHKLAQIHCDKALSLNPNEFIVLATAALTMAYLGNYKAGIELVEHARRNDPYCTQSYQENYFDVYYLAGDYEKAIECLMDWRNLPPHMHGQLAAAYAMLDRIDEAHEHSRLFKERNPKGWASTKARQTFFRMCVNSDDY
ncbi:MAG: hypothetical protein HON65_12065, partial [Rhodospirillales bacterium]|nr:hypothetical protein [Rhodospirillales bacterium]